MRFRRHRRCDHCKERQALFAMRLRRIDSHRQGRSLHVCTGCAIRLVEVAYRAGDVWVDARRIRTRTA